MNERLTHGTLTVPILTRDGVRSSLRDLDKGTLEYKCANYGAFILGATAPLFPGLTIQDIDERRAPDGNIECTLDVQGLRAGTSKQTALAWQEDPFSFDVAEQERIELKSATDFTWAAALTGYANMLLVGPVGTEDRLDNRWVRRKYQYKGIKKTGLTHRQTTVNDNIVSPSDPIIVNLGLAGDHAGALRSSVSLPRVQVTETLKSTSLPNMTAIPGVAGTPLSGVAFPAVTLISISGDVVYNSPYGWVIKSIAPEQLHANSAICVVTAVYEYVWPTQF